MEFKYKISVVVITYNHEKFIIDTLNSIFEQNIGCKLQLIISDDCSTDTTLNKIDDYFLKKYSNNIDIVINRNIINKGVAKNFIWTLERAEGEYIAICEGDDFWGDELKLKKQIDFLEENPEYVTCFHDAKIINENNEIVSDFYKDNTFKRDLSQIDLKKGAHTITCTRFFKNVVKKYPIEMNDAPGQDAFLTSLLGLYGKGKFLHNINPAFYRIHQGGVYSQKTLFEQEKSRFLTRLALYRYYKRLNNIELKKHFYNMTNSLLRHLHYLACKEVNMDSLKYYYLIFYFKPKFIFTKEAIVLHKSQIKLLYDKIF